MTDVETTAPAGAGDEQPAAPITEADIISRGKGMSREAVLALAEDDPKRVAYAEWEAFVARYKAAEAEWETVSRERMENVYVLKNEHDIGFSALAEPLGVTSSLILYLHERAQGKTAKQIREESQRSSAAKEQFRESNPDAKPARKQTPEEKAFRKQQREALKAFLEQQRAEGADTTDAEAEVAAEEAFDAQDDT